MNDDDSRLDKLFASYRAVCPEVEPNADFMPNVWRKIEARRSFWFVFRREARAFVTASAALCLVLLLLNLAAGPNTHLLAPSYTDALMADHTAEKTYYTEALRSTPATPEDSLHR